MINVVVLTTGPLLTIDEAKAHLHVDSPDEDELIELYADAAVMSCLTWCDLKLVPQGAEPLFKAASLLNLGDLYANRAGVVAGQTFGVNPTAQALLQAYRPYRV